MIIQNGQNRNLAICNARQVAMLRGGQWIIEPAVLSPAVKSQIYTEYAANPTLAAQVWKAANVYAKAHPAMIDTINANPTWYWGDFIYFYQQVEWIGFNGNNSNTTGQYIILNIIPNSTDKVILDCDITQGATGLTNWRTNSGRLLFNFKTPSNPLLEIVDGSGLPFGVTGHHKYYCDCANSKWGYDNVEYVLGTITYYPLFNFCLGGWWELNSVYYRITGKVYGLQFVNRCETYPCYNKSSQIIGMFDVVNGVFYTNQGTGTFTKGADV